MISWLSEGAGRGALPSAHMAPPVWTIVGRERASVLRIAETLIALALGVLAVRGPARPRVNCADKYYVAAAGQLDSIKSDGRFIVIIGPKLTDLKTLELSSWSSGPILPSDCAFWQLD
jgi:hypothetical protein